MTDVQTDTKQASLDEARVIAKRWTSPEYRNGLSKEIYTLVATALSSLRQEIAAKDEKIQALDDECQQSMLDIARERDRAERAEAQLAEAKEELNVLRANQIAHVEVRARLTDQLAEARKALDKTFDAGFAAAFAHIRTGAPEGWTHETDEDGLVHAVPPDGWLARELSALEGQQPVAWLTNLGWIDSPRYTVSFDGDKSGCDNFPVYTRPAEQVVTDEMVSAAEEVFFKTDDHGEPSYDMRAALKAAMEAGHGVHLHPHEVVV